MADDANTTKSADTKTAAKTSAKVESDPSKLPEVESNHNTTEPAKPVLTAQVKSMPDYNPKRKTASFANVQSDTTNTADTDAQLVELKGDRKTVEERDATSPWGEKTGASAEGAEDGTDAAKTPTNKAKAPAEALNVAEANVAEAKK